LHFDHTHHTQHLRTWQFKIDPTIANSTHREGQFDTPIAELPADLFKTVAGIQVPEVFYKMAIFVMERGGRKLEGVFRTCGSKSRMGLIKVKPSCT